MMHLDFFQTVIVDHGIYPCIPMHTRLFQTEPFWIHMKSTIYIVCHLFSKKKICVPPIQLLFFVLFERPILHVTRRLSGDGLKLKDGHGPSRIFQGLPLSTFFFKHLWPVGDKPAHATSCAERICFHTPFSAQQRDSSTARLVVL